MKTILILLLLTGIARADQLSDIARTLAAEAGGDGIDGMRAVGMVIANRSKKYKQSIYKVVTAENQFYGYTARNGSALYAKVKQEADQVARELVEGRLIDKTGGALYFINPRFEKPFPWCKVKTYSYKNHTFYK
jgi:spore germination cell wall hydrolase CwlJ-like protein